MKIIVNYYYDIPSLSGIFTFTEDAGVGIGGNMGNRFSLILEDSTGELQDFVKQLKAITKGIK